MLGCAGPAHLVFIHVHMLLDTGKARESLPRPRSTRVPASPVRPASGSGRVPPERRACARAVRAPLRPSLTHAGACLAPTEVTKPAAERAFSRGQRARPSGPSGERARAGCVRAVRASRTRVHSVSLLFPTLPCEPRDMVAWSRGRYGSLKLMVVVYAFSRT